MRHLLSLFSLLLLLTLPTYAATLPSSTFDTNTEGWTEVGDGNGPFWEAANGNPDGHIRVTDRQSGTSWYFGAPTPFLGDQSAVLGGTLRYDLKQSATSSQFSYRDDVVLIGGGHTLYFTNPSRPGTDWTHYEVPLVAEAGWRHFDTFAVATSAEFSQTLAALTDLHIRGEFRNGADTGYLDNVALTAAPVLSPTTYTVNSNDDNNDGTCDSAHCSLREAITAANTNPGTDTIDFALPARTLSTTIAISGTLPPLTDPFVLDGTIPGGRVTLDGTQATDDGLIVQTYASTITAIVANSFPDSAIVLQGHGNTVADSYLGTDETGTLDHGNGGHGILVSRAAGNHLVGNLVSGNVFAAIRVEDSASYGNIIEGNRVGTDHSGTVAVRNDNSGIAIDDAPATIVRNNLLSGNGNGNGGTTDSGILVTGEHADDVVIQGNKIGTDVSGTSAIHNNRHGILVTDGADRTQIGGVDSAESNLISGNIRVGIVILDTDSDDHVIEGNYIGTDHTGTAPIPNNRSGIYIDDADFVRIGDTRTELPTACTGACNLISGNGTTTSHHGIELNGNANRIHIEGNFVGTDPTGTQPLGNFHNGIQTDGPNAIVLRNLVAYNGCNGIRTQQDGQQIEANSLRDNGCDGIRAAGSNTVIADNAITENAGHGIYVQTGEDNNLLQNNTLHTNGGNGIQFEATGSKWVENHTVTENDIRNSGANGFRATGSRIRNLTLTHNTIFSNTLDGVLLQTTVTGAGITIGEGNNISENGGNGVTVLNASGQAVRGSTIVANGGLAIDLGNDGTTANDPGDTDTGANGLQNHPVIGDAAGGAIVWISATLDTLSDTVHTLDFYAATTCGDAERYLGSVTEFTDDNGKLTITQAFGAFVPAGDFVMATVTGADNSTSELSPCFPVRGGSGALTGVVETVSRSHDATVTLYRQTPAGWFQLDTTTPESTGGFQFTNLAGGSYALYTADSSGQLAPEYFDNADSFATAIALRVTETLTTTLPTTITLTAGGSITGLVTDEATGDPLSDIFVTALFDNDGVWETVGSATTGADGQYTVENLAGGGYRVYFFDPNGLYSSEYFSATDVFEMAQTVTVTRGMTTAAIDASLTTDAPLVDWETGGLSVPCTVEVLNNGEIRIRRHRSKPYCEIVVNTPPGLISCPGGDIPTDVVLNSEVNSYLMADLGNGSFSTGNITIATSWSTDRNLTLTLDWTCNGSPQTIDFGLFQLYDPSGFVTDVYGDPIVGAKVTLHKVPGWRARTHPADAAGNTCESNLSKSAELSWSQAAPTTLGVVAAPLPTEIDPQTPTQMTNSDGYYGWDVAAGCWYVVVEKEGFFTLTSPVVGVPTEVTDLDLTLTHVPATAVTVQHSAANAAPTWSVILAFVVLALGAKLVPHAFPMSDRFVDND